MDKNKLKEMIREIVDKVLDENQPAVEPDQDEEVKTKPKPGESKPGKPKRRTLNPEDPGTLPDVNPKAQGKKTMSENEILKQIVTRFNNKPKQ